MLGALALPARRAVRRGPGKRRAIRPSDTTEMAMTAQTQTRTRISTPLGAIAVCALIGLAVVAVVGHAQTTALHAAAHDARHAAGFPCH